MSLPLPKNRWVFFVHHYEHKNRGNGSSAILFRFFFSDGGHERFSSVEAQRERVRQREVRSVSLDNRPRGNDKTERSNENSRFFSTCSSSSSSSSSSSRSFDRLSACIVVHTTLSLYIKTVLILLPSKNGPCIIAHTINSSRYIYDTDEVYRTAKTKGEDQKQDTQHTLNNTGKNTRYTILILIVYAQAGPSEKRISHTTQHSTTTTTQHKSTRHKNITYLLLTEVPRKTATNAGTDRSRTVRPRRAPPPAPSPAAPTSTITSTITADTAAAGAADTVTCACLPLRDRRFSARCRYRRRGSAYSIAEGALHFARGDFLVGMVGRSDWSVRLVGRCGWSFRLVVGRSVFRSAG